MAVAGLLAQYMSIKSQISYVQLQDTRWNDLATAMSKKLSEQENLLSKWEDASGKVDDAWGNESTTLTYKGETYWDGKYGPNAQKYVQTLAATKYANARVPKFDKEKLDEYTDLDMEYSTMVAMYDTLLDELKTQEQSTGSAVKEDAGRSPMLNG